MNAMHVDRYGRGAPLLLIHGWGMHGGMWSRVVERLSEKFCVLVVDLPGHGHSVVQDSSLQNNDVMMNSNLRLDCLADQLAVQFDGSLTLCGWSLGGLIAQRWALRQPQQISRLALVASTPCFVRRPGWDCAMENETLTGFSAALQKNYALALRRFLALQVRGSERERELLAELRGALASRNDPDIGALQAGLEILRDCDLRGALADIAQPVLVVTGERDTLTPMAASHYMAERIPDARLATIMGAAHAPFLSHTDEFLKHLTNFLHE